MTGVNVHVILRIPSRRPRHRAVVSSDHSSSLPRSCACLATYLGTLDDDHEHSLPQPVGLYRIVLLPIVVFMFLGGPEPEKNALSGIESPTHPGKVVVQRQGWRVVSAEIFQDEFSQ